VAVDVVDVLEAIEVDHHDCGRLAGARRPRRLTPEVQLERPPVGEPRQAVGAGGQVELRHQLLDVLGEQADHDRAARQEPDDGEPAARRDRPGIDEGQGHPVGGGDQQHLQRQMTAAQVVGGVEDDPQVVELVVARRAAAALAVGVRGEGDQQAAEPDREAVAGGGKPATRQHQHGRERRRAGGHDGEPERVDLRLVREQEAEQRDEGGAAEQQRAVARLVRGPFGRHGSLSASGRGT
jgi:hypothetical protein